MNIQIDCVHISPPWGGIDYAYNHFDLQSNIPGGIT